MRHLPQVVVIKKLDVFMRKRGQPLYRIGTVQGRSLRHISAAAVKLSRPLAILPVMLAPFPFGSTSPLWCLFWSGMLLASLFLARLGHLRRRHFLVISLVVGLFGILLGITTAQTLIYLPGIPAFDGWAEASRLLNMPLPSHIAALQEGFPARQLAPELVFTLAFLRIFILAAERGEGRRVANILALAGLAYAVWGIASFVIDPQLVLWREKIAYTDSLTGTFINRNTAATFFGGCANIWFIKCISEIRRWDFSEGVFTAVIDSFTGQAASKTFLFALFGFLTCLGATAATGSRAGLLLTLLVMAIMAFMQFLRSLRTLYAWLFAIVLVVAGLALLLQLIGGHVASRIESIGLRDQSRFSVYVVALRMIADHPWLGVGLGGFEAIFPSYRTADIGDWGTWDRAHSTPLEMAVELGIPFCLLLAIVWIGFASIILAGILKRGKTHSVSLFAFSFGLLGTLHSMIDFSLQIPGFSLYFAAFTAAGVAIGLRNPEIQKAVTSEKADAAISANVIIDDKTE